MTTRELNLSELNVLRSRTYLCEFGGKHNPSALIFELDNLFTWLDRNAEHD